MKLSNLRAFLPTDGAMVRSAGGERFRLAGHDPIYDRFGCKKNLQLNVGNETLNVSVTSVEKGETIILRRGEGKPDVRKTFDRDGVVLDAPIRSDSPALRLIRGRSGVGLNVQFEPATGVERTERGATVFHASTAHIRSVSLSLKGSGDCELSVID